MKIAVICLNNDALPTANVLQQGLETLDIHVLQSGQRLQNLVEGLFPHYEGLVFFCATGIAVRMIAPFLNDKYHDPAVVVVDNGCRFAISLLSGHEGGANRLAVQLSRILAATPVITTATEARKNLVLGIGARKGVSKEQVLNAVHAVLAENGFPVNEIRTAATIGLKCREKGLVAAMEELGISLERVTDASIRTFGKSFEPSAAARHLDIPAVAEPCAMLAARDGELIVPKQCRDGVTIAIARERNFCIA